MPSNAFAHAISTRAALRRKQSGAPPVVTAMDIVAIIAERKIEEGLQAGAFGGLPRRGRIDCSVHGEMFFAWWFRDRYAGRESDPEVRSDAEVNG